MGNAPSNPTVSGTQCFQEIYGPPPGQFCKTTHGTTHYVLEGPKNAPLVILQHGLGGDTGRLETIAQDLVKKLGFQVLRYDLYDRGYSETDPTKYPIAKVGVHPLSFTMEMHVQQMQDVLTHLQLDQTKFVHCGHSMGGLVGTAYAATHPDHVQGLVLMDAVCLPVTKPFLAKLADLPVIGDILSQKFGVNTFVKFSRSSVVDPAHPEVASFLDKQEQNTRQNPRFFASIRSTNGNCRGMIDTAEPEFRQCCEAGIPMHLIWGKADTSVPYSNCIRMKEIAQEIGKSAVDETSFEDMPHNIMFPDAKPEECSRVVGEFAVEIFGKQQ